MPLGRPPAERAEAGRLTDPQGRGGEGVPRAEQEQGPGVDGGLQAVHPGQAVPAPLPELLPGGAVARGAPFVGADGPRDAVGQPAAQGGPRGGPQAERLVGEHQVDGHALGVVAGNALPERHMDDRVRGVRGEGEQPGEAGQSVVVPDQVAPVAYRVVEGGVPQRRARLDDPEGVAPGTRPELLGSQPH
ncbi:hypothetical protein GCM10019016_035180 [Streptomyces prasinosporus]|uniref:Uncharacterized protein n=1 Tax=Streptomyces prasinosporus TaxID=68256 RepID=A0ABP6TMB6_9ACTN|nr:hypothetical protein GCM10010332_32980 [Streptomyces albogriseolus]